MIHSLATGALIACGFFGASLLLLAVVFCRAKPKAAEPTRSTKLDDMTDAEVRGKIIAASADLDLWIRVAALRRIRVDGTLLTIDGHRPQFRVRVYDHADGFAEWPMGPVFLGPKVTEVRHA